MKRFVIALAAVLAGLSVTGCSTAFLMELNTCNCFTLRQGVTPEQFEGPDTRTHSLLGPRHKPQPQSTQKFQVGDDVWEVWVYNFYSEYQSAWGSWAGEASEQHAVNNTVNDLTGSSTVFSHQEYVAFRNGLLESWGRGTLPGVLKGKTAVSPRQSRDGR